MNSLFQSFLSKHFGDYLDHKRALGRKFINEERALRLFDRFLVSHEINDMPELQSALIDSFLTSRPRKRPRSYNHLLCVLRCFFNWMIRQELLNLSPVTAQPRKSCKQERPFLFEPAQVDRLLALAAQLPDNSRAAHRGEIYRMIFSLMYGLGLRVGEVTRLQYKDIDLEQQLLVINKSKFGKTRLVPFGPKMAKSIMAYLALGVDWYGQWTAEAPVFAFSRTRAYKFVRTETVSQVFHKLVLQLDFNIPLGVGTPRLHCLRHSFAVETLLRWYRSGIDPNQRLFQLSTFMGHVDPLSTAWYLTITDNLLQEANQRFEQYVSAQFREDFS